MEGCELRPAHCAVIDTSKIKHQSGKYDIEELKNKMTTKSANRLIIERLQCAMAMAVALPSDEWPKHQKFMADMLERELIDALFEHAENEEDRSMAHLGLSQW